MPNISLFECINWQRFCRGSKPRLRHAGSRAATITCFVLASWGLTTPAPAADATFEPLLPEAENRITLSERQRLLAARMTMATCFLEMDLAVSHYSATLAKLQSEFENTLHGLRDSDDLLGLSAIETDDEVLNHHDQVLESWAMVSKALNVMQLTDRFGAPFSAYVYGNEHGLVDHVNALAATIGTVHGQAAEGTESRQAALRTLRILAHHVSGELCLAALPRAKPGNPARLTAALAGLEVLQANIAQAPVDIAAATAPPPRSDTLTDAVAAWVEVHALAKAASETGDIDRRLLIRLLQATEALMSEPPGTRRSINVY